MSGLEITLTDLSNPETGEVAIISAYSGKRHLGGAVKFETNVGQPYDWALSVDGHAVVRVRGEENARAALKSYCGLAARSL